MTYFYGQTDLFIKLKNSCKKAIKYIHKGFLYFFKSNLKRIQLEKIPLNKGTIKCLLNRRIAKDKKTLFQRMSFYKIFFSDDRD